MSSAPLSDLTTSGNLRVGINFGNALLANRDADGKPTGIAVDLARELGRRAGVTVDIVSYATAGQMANGARAGAWDVAFLATDPERATEIVFTPPYLEIEITYLVRSESPLRNVSEVDHEGVRIAVSEKSAYDLFLSRYLRHAQLVRVPGVEASIDLFFAETLDALAGLKPMLIELAEKHGDSRLLDGRLSAVQQAIGVPRGRDAAAVYLTEFVREIKASGRVAELIEKNGIRGVSVPL